VSFCRTPKLVYVDRVQSYRDKVSNLYNVGGGRWRNARTGEEWSKRLGSEERQSGRMYKGAKAGNENKNNKLRVVQYTRLMGGYSRWFNREKGKGRSKKRVVKGWTGGPERETKGMVVITSIRMGE
jgi:hypothetical protein